MAARGIEYREAVDWLKERFTTSEGLVERPAARRRTEEVKIIPKPKQAFIAPARDDSKWPAVRSYLINDRWLLDDIVDVLHENGLLYADEKQNAVFLRHETKYEDGNFVRGEVTGANLRGTYGDSNFKGLAEGTVRADGWHWFGVGGGPGLIQKIVLTEAPIDAVSYAMLDENREGKTIYLSTDGSGDIPAEQIRQAMDQGARVVVAYDSTEIGSEYSKKAARKASDGVADKILTPQALKVIEEGGEVLVVRRGSQAGQTLLSRTMPSQHKDWNEKVISIELKALEKERNATQKQELERRKGRSR